MGLTDDIYEVMKTSMESDVELDATQNNNLLNMSEGIANAVIDFLTKQTFTITEMKSILEVEEISTTGPLQADVLPNVTTAAGGPVVQGKNGVLIPTVSLKKFGGQGGSMKATGYAYVGRNPVDSEESNEDLTKVKLLEENIIGR
tara:strand:- start:54 stop:488 length:435 start_codon:yes stop_codon:yes gene_type:complete